MKKITKYVIMRFYTPVSKHYSEYEIYTYSVASGNRDYIVRFCHQIRMKETYKNNSRYKWYIVTEEQAREQMYKLHEWQKEEERKDLERRFPVRYYGQTAREELFDMMRTR